MKALEEEQIGTSYHLKEKEIFLFGSREHREEKRQMQ